jgi:hypothetical protein
MRLAHIALPLTVLACSSESPPQVVISEIMYHPVAEDGPVEEHEYIELHNLGGKTAALGGWKLTGGVQFTFPEGTTLGPQQQLVVAKNRTRLLAVAGHHLTPAQVVGDYQGELDNAGERLTLQDAGGRSVDDALWADGFPWPIGADALGAGASWLPADKLGGQTIDGQRFMGRSLERRSLDKPGTMVSSWNASPLGGTPGRPNSETGAPLAVVTQLMVHGGMPVRPADQPAVRVFLLGGAVTAPQIEFFVDDLEKTDEATTRAALLPVGNQLEASLPAQKAGSLVRYRVWGDRGKGAEVISPRPSDPYDWHAYFVGDEIAGKTPVYRLFIRKSHWELLWDYIQDGRVPGHVGTLGGKPGFCTPNPFWDARVPAVLVVDGRVFDVQVRYQGSGVNRVNGARPIDPRALSPEALALTPARPNPLFPLSWHVVFPRFNQFDKRRTFNLNKLADGSCLGFSHAVGAALFEQAGIPASAKTHYVRLYINGTYYNYVQRIEHTDEDMLRRYYGKSHPIGDLFKSDGIRWEQGPWGWGDERLLEDNCGYTAAQRYDTTYERGTLTDWKQGSAEVKKLIEDLHAARAAGVPAMRKFFEDNFDRPLLTTYMAVRNWLAPWDDYFHNHFFYRRTDGRWMMIPNDFDGEMGINGLSTPETSFFNGRDYDRSNRNNWMNYLKDAYLRSFRDEHIARLRELSQDVLHPSNVEAVIDEAVARYDLAEAKMAPNAVLTPMVPLCSLGDAPAIAARMKTFARRRYERIADGLFD